MSGELDSRKDSHTSKFKWRPQILVKLNFRELCDSKLSGSRPDYLVLLFGIVLLGSMNNSVS